MVFLALLAPYVLWFGVFGLAVLAIGFAGLVVHRYRRPAGRHRALDAPTGRHAIGPIGSPSRPEQLAMPVPLSRTEPAESALPS